MLVVYSLDTHAYPQYTLKGKIDGKQDFSVLLQWAMWLRKQRNGDNPNWWDYSFNIFTQAIDLELCIPQQCYRCDLIGIKILLGYYTT